MRPVHPGHASGSVFGATGPVRSRTLWAQAAQPGSLWQGGCGELPLPVFVGSCLVLLHVFSPSPRVGPTLSGLKKDGCAGLALWFVGVVCVRVCGCVCVCVCVCFGFVFVRVFVFGFVCSGLVCVWLSRMPMKTAAVIGCGDGAQVN